MNKLWCHRASRTLSLWECVNTHRLKLAKRSNGVRAHGALFLGAHETATYEGGCDRAWAGEKNKSCILVTEHRPQIRVIAAAVVVA